MDYILGQHIMTVEENDEAWLLNYTPSNLTGKHVILEQDGVLGDANVRFLQDLTGKNLCGIDATDPNGLDDVVVHRITLTCWT